MSRSSFLICSTLHPHLIDLFLATLYFSGIRVKRLKSCFVSRLKIFSSIVSGFASGLCAVLSVTTVSSLFAQTSSKSSIVLSHHEFGIGHGTQGLWRRSEHLSTWRYPDLYHQLTPRPFLVHQDNSTSTSRRHTVTLTCACSFSSETPPAPATCSMKPLMILDRSSRSYSCKLSGMDHLVPLLSLQCLSFQFFLATAPGWPFSSERAGFG